MGIPKRIGQTTVIPAKKTIWVDGQIFKTEILTQIPPFVYITTDNPVLETSLVKTTTAENPSRIIIDQGKFRFIICSKTKTTINIYEINNTQQNVTTENKRNTNTECMEGHHEQRT